jgi:SAM-dependent methyltransferase
MTSDTPAFGPSRRYVLRQYRDDERLNVRARTHQLYSESKVVFPEWVLGHLGARTGDRVLDVGSGPGEYHGHLRHVRVTAVDLSPGIIAKLAVPAVIADAQALPFRDGVFDRAMANHVLYLVQDRTQALRELRRITCPGGRVVMATNSRSSMARLFDIVSETAVQLRLPNSGPRLFPFSLEDLELVRSVFPDSEVAVFEDALVFADAQPVLDYVGSQGWVADLSADQRRTFLGALAERIDAIIARSGSFRVPKSSGCFIADA